MTLEQSLDNQEEETLESAFELVLLIQNFNDEYFNDEYEVLKFNINFLESNGFAYQAKVDYMKLNRFIASAYSTIEANDVRVIDFLLTKFYKDIIFLNNFYKNFFEKSKDINNIFKHHFLSSCGSLEALYAALNSKEEKSGFEEYVKEAFTNEFKKSRDEYDKELRLIINTKTYYFDKLLWREARKSNLVVNFLKKAKRSDKDSGEEFSTKMFIVQYLQTVDLTHAKDMKWHQYLQKIILIMD